MNYSSRLFGSRATYVCDHGYHVVGLQSRLCLGDGNWAGSEPALCKQNSKASGLSTVMMCNKRDNFSLQFIASLHRPSTMPDIPRCPNRGHLTWTRLCSTIATPDMQRTDLTGQSVWRSKDRPVGTDLISRVNVSAAD